MQTRTESQDTLLFRFSAGIGFLVIFVTRAIAFPHSYWERDEILYGLSLGGFNPLAGHPPMPGYPLFVALAGLINLRAHSPFIALVTLSLLSNLLGYVALVFAFRRMTGDPLVGPLGALLFFMSPVMLVHATTPIPDPLAIMFLALAIFAISKLDALPDALEWRLVLGLAAASAIGCRPQYAVAALALLSGGLLIDRGTRNRLVPIVAFAIGCAAWVVPLARAAGGFDSLAWVARDLFAQGDGPASLVARCVTDPWGVPWIWGPVLALAVAGVVVAVRRRAGVVLPIAIMGVAHVVFTLMTSGRVDAVRDVIPLLMTVAFFAAVAVSSLTTVTPATLLGSAGLFGLAFASWLYARPVLLARLESIAPPAKAAQYIRENMTADVRILVAPSLATHASVMLEGMRTEPLAGTPQRAADTVMYVEGGSTDPAARSFEWRDSDAYRRLTRDRYRVVSVVPLGTIRPLK